MNGHFELLFYRDRGADIGPVVETFHVGVGDIDTAVTHRMAEIVMPVGSMDVVIERAATLEHEIPFGVWETVIGAVVVDERTLDDDGVLAGRGRGAWKSAGYLEFTDETVALEVAQVLVLEGDDNVFRGCSRLIGGVGGWWRVDGSSRYFCGRWDRDGERVGIAREWIG